MDIANLEGKFMSTAEAGEALGLSEVSIRRYCNQEPQLIKGVKIGRDWFIPLEEVERYEKERRPRGRPRVA